MEPRKELTPNTEVSPNQDYIDKRAIEVLITTMSKVPETQEDDFLIALRNREPLAALFRRQSIPWGGSLPEVITRLKDAQAAIDRRKNQFIPEEKPPILEAPAEQGQAREEVGHRQEEINELYRLNNEDLDTVGEKEKNINEALARLKIFVAEKKGDERVEVDRTRGGEVEVLFEEDVKAAEELQTLAQSIRDSESRIERYDADIAELAPTPAPGLLRRLWSGNSPVVEEIDNSREERKLTGKKLRTALALEAEEEKLQRLEEQFQTNLEKKQQAFSQLLSITGIDEFSGTLRELVTKIEEGVKTVLKSLWAEFEERQERIALLEQQRDDLEKEFPTVRAASA